jgi:hypothetical protein
MGYVRNHYWYKFTIPQDQLTHKVNHLLSLLTNLNPSFAVGHGQPHIYSSYILSQSLELHNEFFTWVYAPIQCMRRSWPRFEPYLEFFSWNNFLDIFILHALIHKLEKKPLSFTQEFQILLILMPILNAYQYVHNFYP